MTSMLSTRQGLLTRAGNRLKALLNDQQTLLKTQLRSSMDRNDLKELRRQVRSARTSTETELRNVESALDKYNIAADGLDPSTPDIDSILQKVAVNAESAQELISNAQDTLTTLVQMHEKLDDAYEDQNAAYTPPISAVNLSPVPIPKFSGRIWEWENFWHVFNHSVHSQNINNLHKMSYLLDALQGEAKESVEMFEVSELTYPLVINHLKEKYGDNRALVDELLTKLQNCTARSERLLDQQRLCEEITSIVLQLELKNEHVDNTFLQKQIMAKFSVAVQSAVLRQKQHFAVDTWTTRSLLETDTEPEQNLPSDTVLYMEGNVGHSDTFLLIGQAQVLNPRTQNLEVVHILLDTGADRSFVSKTLAERLQLNELNSKHLTITTFGSTTPLKQTCGMTNIRLWDQHGNSHCYTVAKMDILTQPVQRSRLSADDQKFLIDNDIQLSIHPNTTETEIWEISRHCHPDYAFCHQS
ncbi:unnamed protein product [Nippostrongylus brasiliensis]|uniref:Peptidase A2 domain-containing protein n=1 Tax=Nippostrongylus brasiliensis TaxID=27835 RepID=A0A0N4Y5I1_NIPBR|nr:unnamed protein product [Nippostrongylus brasiliensis]